MACVLTMFSALPAASSASARSKAAIAPFMSMRRTTSDSVIQRLTAPPPGLLSCPLHGPSSRHRQETRTAEADGPPGRSPPEPLGKPIFLYQSRRLANHAGTLHR